MSEKRTLYRIPEQGKVCGICAGLGEYLGIEVWLVRVIVVSAVIFSGVIGLPLIIYVVAYFLLDPKPVDQAAASIQVKAKAWQRGNSAGQAVGDIQQRFQSLEQRLQRMERHVTSPAFNLKREIDRL